MICALVACIIDHPARAGARASSFDPSIRTELGSSFLVGTALDARRLERGDAEFQELVLEHFDALTAENAMKWERIHPAPDRWDWAPADALVDFANAHDMYLTGHTLVWHQQTPDWVFEDPDGRPASRALVLERMREHIETIVGRYRGRVHSWDVVNEAIDEDGSMRDSPWRRLVGDDFVEKAFELAHAADPDALLFYNDYNMFKPGRRSGTIELVRRLRAAGIPIHGIGMQGHFRIDYPETLDDVEASILAFAELDVDIAITELDVSVLPAPDPTDGGADITDRHDYDTRMNPFTAGLSAEAEAAFSARYLELFRIFLEHSDAITRVTFWGVHDGRSWRNHWPIRGRTDYPLLIDRNRDLKPVWREIVALARGR
jgi:endo-1,4-beta-xylanase